MKRFCKPKLNHGFRSLRLLLHISSPLLYVSALRSSHLIDSALRLRPKLNHEVFDLAFWGVGFLGSLLNLQDQFGCRQILEVQKDYHQEFLQLSQTSTCADYGASPVRHKDTSDFNILHRDSFKLAIAGLDHQTKVPCNIHCGFESEKEY
ncbi:unnamed protein product [Prunus armeniaca]|uniref:Uncharacterized protein n=1 Tax=Prunus armeniaca TaxID=36596 RepID=A0A6J5WGT6_PRUAR|nr:unnamed protein product [Prunus armeniaca]